jgi:hypothetical protein
VQEQLSSIRDAFTRLVRGYRREQRLPAGISPETVSATIMALLPGFFLQRVMLADVSARTLQRGLQAVLATSPADHT